MIGSALALALPTAAFAVDSAPNATATSSPAAVWEGDTVTLDASASHTNPCCNPLTYKWQQQAPASPMLALTPDGKTVTVTYIAPAVPLPNLSLPVQFRVQVTDDLASGSNKNVNSAPVITTVYASPRADAEPKNQHFNSGTTVTLSGSATRTQPGATLTYTWTAPSGITFVNTDTQSSTLQNPQFVAPAVPLLGQAFTFTLVVTETVAGLAHTQNSAPDSVTINVDYVNQPPSAYASADPNAIDDMAEVDENSFVTLYGSGSDPDGDSLSYHWTQVHDTTGAPLQGGDTVVTLSDENAQNPSFTAPDVSTVQQHSDLVFQLKTNDGFLNSGPSYVTIRVLNTNDPPTAVATATPAAAVEGELVMLDGSFSSDPNMDALTYSWAQVGTPVVNLMGANTVSASFVAPIVSAQQGSITLTFNLTVSDGELSDTKPVSVTVSHRNLPPVADAGQTVMAPEQSSACLDGRGSYDPEGETPIFAWTQLDGPSVTLDNPNSSQPCFNTPNVGPSGDTLHFQLTVSDSHGASSSSSVEVDITYVNHPPTADAGTDQTVNEDAPVGLNGSGTDPDNNQLTFTWTQFSGPAVTLSNANDANATFTAPLVACAGDAVVMTLTVDDGYGGIDSQNVTINIANLNQNPTANGGGNQTNIQEGDLVNLNGSGNDIDPGEAGTLSFQWMQTSGPAVSLSGSGQNVSFTAPSVGSGDPNAFVELGFQLTVADTCHGSATDNVTVHVANIPHAPVAMATGPGTANEGGSTVMLDGSGSSDPDGDLLSYTWTQIAGPTQTLDDIHSATPSFTTPFVSQNTDVKFKLTVSDPYGGITAPV